VSSPVPRPAAADPTGRAGLPSRARRRRRARPGEHGSAQVPGARTAPLATLNEHPPEIRTVVTAALAAAAGPTAARPIGWLA
jgi:hypothetical protein